MAADADPLAHPLGRSGTIPADLVAAMDAYLDHLRVERGLARATIRAYDTDLRLFAAAAPGVEAWAEDPDVARGYLAALTRPPRALRPSSHRRKAASIRATFSSSCSA